MPAQRISEIISGKRSITADADLRLCKFFSLSNGYWLRAQVAHDTEVAERRMGALLKKILNRIQGLADDPRPQGYEKLTDQERYRLRQGRYRILYSIQNDELSIWIVKVGHRKDVYR